MTFTDASGGPILAGQTVVLIIVSGVSRVAVLQIYSDNICCISSL